MPECSSFALDTASPPQIGHHVGYEDSETEHSEAHLAHGASQCWIVNECFVGEVQFRDTDAASLAAVVGYEGRAALDFT
jgi:hypothetical protein